MTPMEIAADPETTRETWLEWLSAQLAHVRAEQLFVLQRATLIDALAEVSAAYSQSLVEIRDLRADIEDMYDEYREAQTRHDDADPT